MNVPQKLKRQCRRANDRRGGILPLTAVTLVAVLGFAALAVDVGFMTQTKSQMQAAADGAALAAALEMPDGWGSGKNSTADSVSSAGRAAALAVGSNYRVGEQSAAYVDSTRDIRFGQRTQDANGAWVETWGVTPYNMVEVTLHRDQPIQGSVVTRADQQVPLFLAPAMGTKYAALTAKATAVLSPGNGFYIPAGSSATCPLLPIAIDETTWNNLINNGVGSDNYAFSGSGSIGCHSSSGGVVTSGSDGIKEITLYPDSNTTLPSGNRGTVDIGSSNNSTADLSRQIRNGPNQADLAYFGGKLQIPASGLLALNGDTGLSAGIKDDLAAIIGQPRAIPVFRSVSGPGNNATYQICKFVGIRILYVKLTGSPSSKKVIVQPAPVFDGTITGASAAMQPDSIMASLKLIH
ncbi:MAG: Flp pilus assembly protein TadG [Planctomycetota bacterium]|nr:MAG: Flp pilus assembly protein TadG [Planctomycetota bacterium]